VSAFILRLVCTNDSGAKTEISASYRHVSTKNSDRAPPGVREVADGLGKQRDRLKLSLESPVADPLATIERFNRQFALGSRKGGGCLVRGPKKAGETMFNVVNTYHQTAAMEGFASGEQFSVAEGWAESAFLLS